jgi:hypothetical protein
MRFVHLTRASNEPRVASVGLAGSRTTLRTEADQPLLLPRAVFAMPVVRDFWTTHQWLRELRRGHREKMIAVHFRVQDAEPVYVGRFGAPHALVTAAEVARWVTDHPAGAEAVIPRSIGPKEVLGIRHLTQLVGWTRVPEAERRSDCICERCLPRGSPLLMRRVRGAIATAMSGVREGTSKDAILAALGALEAPLQRARGRIQPDFILGYARSPHARIRQSVARLLAQFRPAQVQELLLSLLLDEDELVREEAVRSLTRAAGTKRAAGLLRDAAAETVALFVALLEDEPDHAAALSALERFAQHPAAPVREAVVKVAATYLSTWKVEDPWRTRYVALTRRRAGDP